MHRSTSYRIRVAVVAIAVAALEAGAASAQAVAAEDEGPLSYRQNLMSAIGGDMGALADVVKYGLPFRQHVVTHAENIARNAGLVAAAFERRIVDGPTDAKPAIWEKPDEFREKTQRMKDEAAKLAQIAAGGDPAATGQQLKALGQACGSCHESFRKPKEESYKRAAGGGA